VNKLKKFIFPAVIVIIAAIVLHSFSSDYDGRPFAASTTGERGASLLYDTLRHMGYPVRVSRRPLTARTNADYAYIFIQPHHSHFDYAKAEELLDWVYSGGRLIFLHNNPSTILDTLMHSPGTRFGNLTIYEHGQGVLVRGHSSDITNINMINDHDTGARIHAIISNGNTGRIIFAEYYHNPPATEIFFNRLPAIVRLIIVQLGLLGIIIVWHLGKRFGNPIEYYEEHEREENEHVHALARLYMKTRRKR